jgi:Tol biopolymer transport system component
MVLRSTLNRVSFITFLFVLLITSLHITAQGQTASYVTWKPDGNMLAIASGSTVQILNATTMQALNTFAGLAEQVTAPSWSLDGNRLAIANGRSVQVWQNPWNANPQLITTFTYNVGYINSIAWSPGSDRIASVNGSVTTVWNPTNGQIIYSVESHRDYVFDVTWSPDGSQFVTTSIDRTIKLWNAANGTLLSTMLMVTSFSLPVPDDRASVFSPSWKSDGTKLVIGASDSTVRILDRISFNSAEAMSTGNDINVLKGHEGPVWSVDWSPTSNQVASGGEDGTVRIWDVNTGAQLQVIQGVGSVASLEWSPDGSKIAYASEGGPIQIVSAPGSKIAFASYRDGNYEIYSMNADGSSPTRLTNNTAWDNQPNWSPDRSKIAFATDRDGNLEIYSMNANGSNLIRLTNYGAADNYPVWSPNGSKISFTSNRDGNLEIYSMNANGSGLTRLTNNAAADGGPSWSADGTKIAFTTNRNGNFEIYTMNADGSSPTRVTNNSADDFGTAWSPDGTKILFASNRDGNFEVYVMNANGSSPTRLTNNSAADGYYPISTSLIHYGLAWSPDGTQIAFISNRDSNVEVYRMNANGSSPTRLTNNTVPDTAPDW